MRSGRLLSAVSIGLLALAIQAAPATVRAQTPVTWLIFVDDLHLEFRNTGRIRDALRTMVSELVMPGDRFAMSSSGPSSLNVALTSDRRLLDAAIKGATGNALRLEDVMASRDGSVEVLYRASTAVSAARSMLTSLPSEPGRAAMLYLSGGYIFELLADPAVGAPGLRGRRFTRAEVDEQVRDLSSTAARLGIPIITIAPHAVFSADLTLPWPIDPARAVYVTEMQRTLRSLADASGGIAIIDTAFPIQLNRIGDVVRR